MRCFTSQKPVLWILNDFNCLMCFFLVCFPVLFLFFFVFLVWCVFKSTLSNTVHKVIVGMMDGEGGKAPFLSFPINEDCVGASLFHKHKNTSRSPGVATKANLASADGWKNATQLSETNSSQLRLGPSQASASCSGTSFLGHHRRPQGAETV